MSLGHIYKLTLQNNFLPVHTGKPGGPGGPMGPAGPGIPCGENHPN